MKWKKKEAAKKAKRRKTKKQKRKRAKKKKKKLQKRQKKQKKKDDITKETEITAKINEGNVSISMPKNTIEINQSDNSLTKIEEGINDKCVENALDNPKLNILNLLNNILNKIKMGNEVLKEDIDNLQNLMVNIVDGNDKLKKDVEKLTEEMQKKDLEIEKLNQENKNHKQYIGQLIEENITPVYECDCSKEHMEDGLATLDKDVLKEMIEEDGKAELVCHFCNKKYEFSKEELEDILEKNKNN